MRKATSTLMAVLSFLPFACSERRHQKSPTDHTIDLRFDASITECREILLDERERKTAEAIASNWQSSPTCEELVPKLSEATSISLMGREISRIGILRHARSLQTLYMGFNEISDLSPLKEHPTLAILDLQANRISDAAGLGDMETIQILSLNNNVIKNFDGLGQFPKLKTLLARNNQIESVSVLADAMPGIIDLEMTENPLGTTVERSEQNCPTGNDIPQGISRFCSANE